MNQNEEYIEINLKDILFYVLRRWKPMVVCGLVFALLLGSFQAFNEYRSTLNPEENESYWEEYNRYQEQLKLYEDRIEQTQDKIDTLQEYIDHAVMMKADYRNVYVAKATYYIDSDYKIMPELNYQNPDKTYTLTWYYQNFLQDYSVYEEIGEEVGIEAKYLMDLVSVSVVNSSSLSLRVTHPNEYSAQRIMVALQDKLYAVYDQLNSTIDKHTLTPMLDTCGVYVDEAVKDSQQAVYDDMLYYQEELIKLKQEQFDLEEDGGPGELNVPMAFVKWFILGGVLGAVLLGVFYAAKALFSSRIYFQDDLVSRYDLPVLGCLIRSEKKLDPISRWLRRLEGRLIRNSEENQQFLAANFRNRCGENRNILVCSDIGPEQSELVCQKLGETLPEVRFQAVGSLSSEARALQLLPECDAIVMAVTGDKSRNKDIRKAMDMIQTCGKRVIGFVFLDE